MTIRLRPQASGADCLEKLRSCRMELDNLASTGGRADQTTAEYLRWATTWAAQLQRTVLEPDINELVLTDRFYAVLGSSGGSVPIGFPLIDVEVRARKDALDAAILDLAAKVKRWATRGELLVFDTNVFLHGPQRFDELDLSSLLPPSTPRRLLILLVNLDEMDKQERVGNSEVKRRARETLRVIEDSIRKPDTPVQLNALGFEDVEVVLDPPTHVRLPRADDELVDRAESIADLASRPMSFLSADVGLLLRARRGRLNVVHADW